MVDHARAQRLAKRITHIVAEALEHEVKDPRLAMVTITDTRVTGDLREATVFYTVWGDDAARESTAQALESAKGIIRSAVGRGTGLKHTPTIAFVHDALPDDARHIDELLERVRHADQQLHQLAEHARPAGDVDTATSQAAGESQHGPQSVTVRCDVTYERRVCRTAQDVRSSAPLCIRK